MTSTREVALALESGRAGAGQALLTLAVEEEEGTFMVMGAYGHSRIRQFLLGGVTRYVLGRATIPVLLAH